MSTSVYPPQIIEETNLGIQRFDIRDAMLASRELELSGPVDSESVAVIIRGILYLQKVDAAAPITLFINSPGGEVSSGLALYDVMQATSCPIRTVCLGLAASMAALLFMASHLATASPRSETDYPALSRHAATGPFVWPTALARIAPDPPCAPQIAMRPTHQIHPTPAPGRPHLRSVPALFPPLGERPRSFGVMLPESEHRVDNGPPATCSTPHCGLRLFFESLTSAITDSKAEVDPRFRIPSKTSRSSSEPGDSHN